MNGRVEGSLTSNFKVIRQGHVTYFNIFGFYDLNYVENDTNFITLSHLHQKLSRLTNNGKKQCILTTVMYIWRHDMCHVTASRWCHICQNVSPISSNRYAEAIFAIGIIKKVTGEKRQGGWYPPPLGVRGLMLSLVIVYSKMLMYTCMYMYTYIIVYSKY